MILEGNFSLGSDQPFEVSMSEEFFPEKGILFSTDASRRTDSFLYYC